MHLTHPSAHTPGAVGSQRCSAGEQLGFGALLKGLTSWTWTIPPGTEIRTHNLGLQVRRSIH